MTFRVVVTEVNPLADLGAPPMENEIFRQSVEALDLRSVIEAINRRPRKPREPREKTPNAKKEAKA
jgi:hypothetical protein